MATPTLTVEMVREQLGLPEEAHSWLEKLAALELPAESIHLPPTDELLPLLHRLGVPGHQAEELSTARPDPVANPALWWLLERCAGQLILDMGGYDPLPSWWMPLPAAHGALGRYLYIWAFLAVFPVVRRYHAQRGIPDDISWATLEDMGLHMSIHERTHGEGGITSVSWLALHFRGAIYRLGRLQFNRSRIRYDQAVIDATGGRFHTGDPSLGVHIPEIGPMTPEACDASFKSAGEFFRRHFPEDGATVATCNSWLLDDQLATYLPEDSNIVRFQRRFRLVPAVSDCDDTIINFVFRRVKPPLDELPQRTTLQRAVVGHIRSGQHWHCRSGWVAL